MNRLTVVLLLVAGCATARPLPAPSQEPSPGLLKLQLRAGTGTPPCHEVGGGLEICPVTSGPGGVHFLSLADLSLAGEPPPGGATPVEHARFRGLLALAATLSESTLEWMGDDTDSHLVARITCAGDETFDAARLLTLHTHTEDLMDDLGLEYLAVVPDTHMLLVFRDGDARALTVARAVAARGGGGSTLAPQLLFVVNPDGLRTRPW